MLLVFLSVALLWSGIAPRDRATWWLEEAPVLLGVPLLIATRRRFPLTPLAYRLLFIHALLLVVGGHYTFSEVPAGNALRDAFGLARNHFDRLVHFAGGFVPAIVAREILRRNTTLAPGRWLFLIVSLSCLAGSAFYELLEWWAAAAVGADASAFLAMQGDPWDTQWDMFLGLLGSFAGQLLLSRRHERQMYEGGMTDKGGTMRSERRKTLRIVRDDVAQVPPGRDSGEPLRGEDAGFDSGWGGEWWQDPRPARRGHRALRAPAHWLALTEAP